MNEKDYFVRGCTALLDAIGGAIKHIGNIHKYAREEDVPENTIFIITTDGMENASHNYSADAIKKIVERQKDKYNWEFIFLGANIDAVETAAKYGIDKDRTVNYCHDPVGVANSFEDIDYAVRGLRSARASVPQDWKMRTEIDYEKRGGK